MHPILERAREKISHNNYIVKKPFAAPPTFHKCVQGVAVLFKDAHSFRVVGPIGEMGGFDEGPIIEEDFSDPL